MTKAAVALQDESHWGVLMEEEMEVNWLVRFNLVFCRMAAAAAELLTFVLAALLWQIELW